MIKVKTFQVYRSSSKLSLQEQMANVLSEWQRNFLDSSLRIINIETFVSVAGYRPPVLTATVWYEQEASSEQYYEYGTEVEKNSYPKEIMSDKPLTPVTELGLLNNEPLLAGIKV